MAAIELEHVVEAPAADLFRRASDFEHAAEHVSAIVRMEMLTPGRVRVGTRFRETRVMFGKEASEVMEVLELEPPKRYVLGAESHGCRYRTELRFTPEGDATRVRVRFEAEPLTFVAKVLSVLMRPMMKACAKAFRKDLDDIGRAVRGDAPGKAAAASPAR
jgi:carbon monoxide dehydrogenase subunit G